MKNKMITAIYGTILLAMFALAYLIATGIILPGNTLLVAATVVTFLAVIVLDIKLIKPLNRFHYTLNAA